MALVQKSTYISLGLQWQPQKNILSNQKPKPKKYCQNHGFGQFLDIIGIEKHVLKLGKSMVASDKSFEPILHLSHCSHFSLTHITFSHTYHFFSNFFLRFFCSPLLLTLLRLFCIAFSGTSHFFLYFSQIFLNILLFSHFS